MTRDQFLKTIWIPYPAAGVDWLDVRDFLKTLTSPNSGAESAVVAGRLKRAQGRWILESGGAEIEFNFSEGDTLRWLVPSTYKIKPDLSFFRERDLVALRLEKTTSEHALRDVSEILLLAPSAAATPVSKFNVATSRDWNDFVGYIRAFFRDLDFIEARTPTLVPSPGTEPYLDPFSTKWSVGTRAKTFYLPTSPEFHLKQLLVAGWTKVFEFKDCFRNGEIGDHHQPEFLMLEWYRAYANLDVIADDVTKLLQSLALHFKKSVPALRRTTVKNLFQDAFDGFVLKADTTRDELTSLARLHGLTPSSDDSFDDVFFRLFLERIEPGLGADGPILVSHYPPSQAALSRVGEHGFAERFEIYWHGLELANAFHELNDPQLNERRFEEDASRKREIQKNPVPRDENLVRALHAGLPPSGGIALGVDRLFMALFDINDIAETRAFAARWD